MKPGFIKRDRYSTAFVKLDTKKCSACWNCTDSCPKKVIGKINLPWHKHALIVHGENCTGCLKCVKVCRYEALTSANKMGIEQVVKRKSILNSFIINNLLLLSVLLTIVSGLVLQVGFHMMESESPHGSLHSLQGSATGYEFMRGIDPLSTVWGINYLNWSAIHKCAVAFFSVLMVYHFAFHWKWYKGVIIKGLTREHRQVFILTALFLLVAFTGFIPWLIDLSGGAIGFRMAFIEIHDKITFILIIFLFLHLLKKIKWFRNAFLKLSKSHLEEIALLVVQLFQLFK